jgi:molecular chaperone GrpE
VAGVKLIENKFRSVLAAQGLSPIDAVGKLFDPALHEAIMRAQGEEGIVVREMRRGYKLNEKVLRPSQVVVGNGEIVSPEGNKT